MSRRELGRVEVLARVRSKQLKVVDAARLMLVSYRQAKRLWKPLSGGRCCRFETPQRRASIASRTPTKISGQGVAVGARKVRWASRRAVRADAGGGAFGERGWVAAECGNAAALDAGGGFVESRAKASSTPATARAQGTLWRIGADGWELSRLA